ncbi:MAG: hypothetical protein L6R39_004285 [Caloplaca ligustica]|nr:MAG: hypothetical protein L6R39_004285 [Caloplaca ligustica]
MFHHPANFEASGFPADDSTNSPAVSDSDTSTNNSTNGASDSEIAKSVPTSPASTTDDLEGTSECDSAHPSAKRHEAFDSPVLAPSRHHNTITQDDYLRTSLEDDPFGEDEDDSTGSPSKPHDMPYEVEDDLHASPVKVHLIQRPGAPTPGRGRTRHLDDSDSDAEGSSLVVAEDSSMDDIFGNEQVSPLAEAPVLPAKDTSFTCDDSYGKLPPLDRANRRVSTIINALDLQNSYKTDDAHSRLEWLNLHSRYEVEGVVADYQLLSRKIMASWLEEAIEKVSLVKIPPAPAVQDSATDIDLDSFFDGQGATDLDDDISTGADMLEEDPVISYATELLADRTQQDLPWSRFIPTGQKAYDAILAAFNYKGWKYDLQNAKLAAAEVAYYYAKEGLDELKDNGYASRNYPVESDRYLEWESRQRDSAALLPYDPRSSKLEMLRYAIKKPEQTSVSCVQPVWKHYNFLGHTVDLLSSTPATVSLLVQMLANFKPSRYAFSREGVVLSQANKYIDPVAYEGPEELLSLSGAALREQATGYVFKLTDHEGSFGNPSDGESVLKTFQEIWDHFLANGWHDNMQRPWIMNYEEEAHLGLRDWDINEPAPREFFRKRDERGKIVHWNLPRVKKPGTICSKLWKTHSVDDDLDEIPWPSRQVDGVPEHHHKLSVLDREEEQADPILPQQANFPNNFRVAQSGASAVKMLGENASGPDGFHPVLPQDVEYSPLDPCIPGQQRTYEDHQQEEMSDDELSHNVAALLKQAGFVDNTQQQPGASSSEEDSDEDKQLSRATTPPSPAAYDSSLSFPYTSVVNDTPPSSIDWEVDDDSVYDASLSFSKIAAIPNIASVSPIQQLTEAKVSATTPAEPAEEQAESAEPEDESLAKYAFAYGAAMFAIGWIACWW